MDSISDTIYRLRRKFFGRYVIEDPRPIASEAPYTFYLPDADRLTSIEPGDQIKLIFQGIPQSKQYNAERMWVEVTHISGDDLTGFLNNEPSDIPQLNPGQEIQFKIWQVIDIEWQDAEKESSFKTKSRKQYWERCFVDDEVLNGTAQIGFIYKEEPDPTPEGDKDPDSGWRIRADVNQLTQEQYDNPTPVYIALGKVLNVDDSWIGLIDAPVGARFMKDASSGKFIADETDD